MHGNKRKSWLLPSTTHGATLLKIVRVDRQLSSKDAAKLCGMSAGHYSSIENAQREVTDLTLPKLDSFLADVGLDEETRRRVLI